MFIWIHAVQSSHVFVLILTIFLLAISNMIVLTWLSRKYMGGGMSQDDTVILTAAGSNILKDKTTAESLVGFNCQDENKSS